MKLLNWLLALLSLVVLGGVFFQWQVAAGLRRENEKPGNRQNEAAMMSADTSVVLPSVEEMKKLREQNRDLLKLRNEARQMREQVKALTSLRAENERLHNILAEGESKEAPIQTSEGFIAKEALVDAGVNTPEAALQTFLWAMRENNVERFLQVVAPDFLPRKNRNTTEAYPQQFLQQLMLEMKQQIEKFNNFRIVGREEVRPGEVLLKLQSSLSARTAQMRLVLVGVEWKIQNPL